MRSSPTSMPPSPTRPGSPAPATRDLQLQLQHQRRLQLQPADRQRHPGRGQRDLQPGAVSADHQRHQRRGRARSRRPASPPPSSTTTPRPSRSPEPAPPSTRAAPTPTRSISPTRSIPASPSASPSTSPCRRVGGAEAADFTNAFLADIDAAIARRRVTRSGNTLTFDSSFNTSAGFSFTLPTANDTLVEGNETYSLALSAPTTNATNAAVALAPAASVTTTIIDNDTQTFSLTQAGTTVNEGSADTYTIHLSNPIDPGVTVSATIDITLPGGLGGAEAADFTNAFLADIDAAIAHTAGVTRSGNTLTFNSSFDTSAGFSFTLPTANDTLVEGNESYSLALSAPTTNATNAAVALAPAATASPPPSSTTTPRPSRSPSRTTVNEGSADTYTVHLSNPISGVTVSATIAITLPGGLGGAEAADFTNAFLTDIDAAIAHTAGVTRSGNTLTFNSSFNTSAGFSFSLPTANDTLVEGNESYSVALSAPTTNATSAAVVSLPPPPASPPPSSTTTPRPSRSPKPAPPSTRAAPTPTRSISPTRSIPASPSAPPSTSPCRAARRRRGGGFQPMRSSPTSMPPSQHHRGHPLRRHADLRLKLDTSAGFSFTLPAATTPRSRATRATAWRCPRPPPTPPAPRS